MAEWFWTTWWYWYQHRDEEQLRKIDDHSVSTRYRNFLVEKYVLEQRAVLVSSSHQNGMKAVLHKPPSNSRAVS